METINNHINNTFDEDVIERLKEKNLVEVYLKQKSVQTEIGNLREILEKNSLTKETINNIISDYTLSLVPPGTKGVVKGNIFNNIVKEKILEIEEIKTPDFEIRFEHFHPEFPCDERPDWYIFRRSDKKIMIGMNQLDLWGGGQQINRGSKYVMDDIKHSDPNIKHLSVVCNYIQLKSDKNKVFKIFEKGFKYKRLCFIKELGQIVCSFFRV